MQALTFAVLALAIASGMAQKSQPDPCAAKSKLVADVNYCDRYWECVKGEPKNFDCPNGLVFSGRKTQLLQFCHYPWMPTLGDVCEDKQLANPPISSGVCDWQYGVFGHEKSCIRYWSCWNGTASEQFCPGGLLYNEESHDCDWPSQVTGCQKHPLCADDPTAVTPLGKSCNRYWQCQGGYPRLQQCPASLVFDRKTLRCVNPPTEDCDAPPPPPPEESSEERQEDVEEDDVDEE